MRTILFYALKGGVDKSVMAANFAVCLARLGKSVAAIDLDLQSPLLHCKFGRQGQIAMKNKGGALDYLRRFCSAAERGHASDFQYESIDNHITRFRVIRQQDVPLSPGVIHFLPAGDITADDYVAKLSDWRLSQLLTDSCSRRSGAPSDPRTQVSPDVQSRIKDAQVSFFEAFQKSLSRLDPPPEYLLVDLAAGFEGLYSVCMRLWPDVVVLPFTLNYESTEGTLIAMDAIRNLPTSPLLVPVATRISPTAWTESDGRESVVRQRMNLDRNETLHVIRSDRQGDMDVPCVRIGADESVYVIRSDRRGAVDVPYGFEVDSNPRNSHTTQDYVDLIAAVTGGDKQDSSPESIAQRANDIRMEFGIPLQLQITERVFGFFSDQSSMVNPDDGTRNVALKVETFVNMLLDIVESIEPMHWSDTLFRAGLHVGLDFGYSLTNVWCREAQWKGRSSVEDRMSHWCEFDSQAGFGNFRSRFGKPEKNGTRQCIVTLRNSFLHDFPGWRAEAEPNLCKLMHGYVQGVARAIVNEDTVVAHRHDGSTCEFSFAVPVESHIDVAKAYGDSHHDDPERKA